MILLATHLILLIQVYLPIQEPCPRTFLSSTVDVLTTDEVPQQQCSVSPRLSQRDTRSPSLQTNASNQAYEFTHSDLSTHQDDVTHTDNPKRI